MESKDRRYFLKRAQDELLNARASDDPAAARSHFRLAGLYLNRARPETDKDLDRHIGAACSAREPLRPWTSGPETE